MSGRPSLRLGRPLCRSWHFCADSQRHTGIPPMFDRPLRGCHEGTQRHAGGVLRHQPILQALHLPGEFVNLTTELLDLAPHLRHLRYEWPHFEFDTRVDQAFQLALRLALCIVGVSGGQPTHDHGQPLKCCLHRDSPVHCCAPTEMKVLDGFWLANSVAIQPALRAIEDTRTSSIAPFQSREPNVVELPMSKVSAPPLRPFAVAATVLS